MVPRKAKTPERRKGRQIQRLQKNPRKYLKKRLSRKARVLNTPLLGNLKLIRANSVLMATLMIPRRLINGRASRPIALPWTRVMWMRIPVKRFAWEEKEKEK